MFFLGVSRRPDGVAFLLLFSRANERSGWCPGIRSSSLETEEYPAPLGCEMVLVDYLEGAGSLGWKWQ